MNARYTVAVRALCEFSAKEGDLDLRFTPAPTAQEGIEGHQLLAARRPAHVETEVALSGTHGPLRVRGRADLYDPLAQRLEEVKTHKGDLARQAANQRALHWAQLKVYGALLCAERGLAELELALVYVNVQTQVETVLTVRHSAAELQAVFAALCDRFQAWAEQELAHRARRDAAWAELAFPHPDFRAGQRDLAEAVYRTAMGARVLLAQAPTGIGKTMGTLFPVLKAAPRQGLDKVFCLSAKSTGRALVLAAQQRLQGTQGPQDQPGTQPVWRTLELVARDKACVHPDRACHGESCPLAQGFYDRLPAARAEAVQRHVLDHATVAEVAQAHTVCPYYLSQELARWADLVVGDYHYWFDEHALLYAHTQAQDWRVAVLVDEAHNLVERARQMYTAELAQVQLRGARRVAPSALKRPFDRLHRAWLAVSREQTTPYTALDTVPEAWLAAAQGLSLALSQHAIDHPTEVDPILQGFALSLLQLLRRIETFGPHSLFDIQHDGHKDTTLSVRNVLPAPFLDTRFAAAHAMVLFSATLQPPAYHQRLLGLPARTVQQEVASPFRAEQLQVCLARHVSTRWADRRASAPAIVEVMAQQFVQRPGLYLAFFSSHDYLQDVAAQFEAACPQVPVWRQTRGMREAEQRAFLARFEPGAQGIGFAVLGGAFAEGIDLPGERLIGAFIATLGLPQVNPVTEQFRQRLQSLLGAGYDYAYLYPGLQKVVQAAGRVIRTPHDAGVLHLLDDRYARHEVQRLLPSWWPASVSPAVSSVVSSVGDTPGVQ